MFSELVLLSQPEMFTMTTEAPRNSDFNSSSKIFYPNSPFLSIYSHLFEDNNAPSIPYAYLHSPPQRNTLPTPLTAILSYQAFKIILPFSSFFLTTISFSSLLFQRSARLPRSLTIMLSDVIVPHPLITRVNHHFNHDSLSTKTVY